MSSKEPKRESTAEIRSEIERTRADMSKTVNQIEERLSPAHLKEQLADLTNAAVSQYHEVKDHLKADLKDELAEAKQIVKEELSEAKEVVNKEIREAKHAVTDEIEHVKTVAYDATVGRAKHMAHDAGETVMDAGTSVLETIKRNPIPAALVAVGIGWLVMNSRQQSARRMRARYVGSIGTEGVYGTSFEGETGGWRVREKASDFAHRAGDRVGHLAGDVRGGAASAAHEVRERAMNVAEGARQGVAHVAEGAREGVAHVAEGARERASQVAHGARDVAMHVADGARGAAMQVAYGARHVGEGARNVGRGAIRGVGRGYHVAEDGFTHAMDVNPLAVGAVALAVGAVVGLALPHTSKEDEWMGETKDRLFDRAKGIAEGVAKDALHQVETVAHGAIQTAEEKLGEQVSKLAGDQEPPRSNGRFDRSFA